MTILSTSVVSTGQLIRAAQRHIHCLFMALPNNLSHKDMLSIALRMDKLNRMDNLEELFKFANELEKFDIDGKVFAREIEFTKPF